MYIDTHSHLNFKSFKDDWQDAVKRAHDVNVMGIINVGSNLETSKKAIEIAHKYKKGVYAAVGLHPIHVKKEDFNYQEYLVLAQDKKVVAIGETGIDLYHDKTTIDLQRDALEKSLRIASSVNKPVIIHNREADEEIYPILLGHKFLPKGVVHCFSSDWEYAKKMLDFGFLISFTGVITYSKNPKTFEAIKNIPLDKIMIETDCPFLAPTEYRGTRNEPAYVIEVAKKIAEIKGINLDEIEKQTTLNAIKLFNLRSKI